MLYSGASMYTKVSQYSVTSKHFWWRQAGKEGLNASVPLFNLFSDEYLIATAGWPISAAEVGKGRLHQRSRLMEVQLAFITFQALVTAPQLEAGAEVTSQEGYSKFLK